MKIRVPASIANLGPGYDVVALAVGLYVEVEVEPARRFELHSVKDNRSITHSEHIVAQFLRRYNGKDFYRVRVESDIPIARGLGSSSALLVGVAKALSLDEAHRLVAEFEGHADNAFASAFGGLVIAKFDGSRALYKRIEVDDSIQVVAMVPEVEISTDEARKVLGDSVKLQSVVTNLQNLSFLLNSFSKAENLAPWMFTDFVHQPRRFSLFPESEQVLDIMLECGAIGSFWAGAGSTVASLVTKEQSSSYLTNLEERLKSCDFKFKYEIKSLNIDTTGAECL